MWLLASFDFRGFSDASIMLTEGSESFLRMEPYADTLIPFMRVSTADSAFTICPFP